MVKANCSETILPQPYSSRQIYGVCLLQCVHAAESIQMIWKYVHYICIHVSNAQNLNVIPQKSSFQQ